jgi:CheY-like chemotaxis protein
LRVVARAHEDHILKFSFASELLYASECNRKTLDTPMSMIAAPTDEPVDFLRHKSGVHKSRITAAKVSEILVIDDSQFDGKSMSALLRSAFGRDVPVRHASSLMRARNMLLERMPDLVVLDDVLPPKDRADTSIPTLRQAGFAGLIIVVSGEMTRVRRLTLLQVGANAVLHKDDLNVMSLVEAAIPAEQRPSPSPVPVAAEPEPEDETSDDDTTSSP